MASSNPTTTRKRLIKTVVEAIPVPAQGKGPARVYDDKIKNYWVQVSNRGVRTFYCYGRPGGRQVIHKLGRFGQVTAEQARTMARKALGAMAAGVDPNAAKREARTAEKARLAAPTVGRLCDLYLEKHAEPKKRLRSRRGDRSLIECHIRPAIGDRKIAEIGFEDLQHLHRKIGVEAPIAANRAMALLSKAFSLAIRWGYRADNPCKGIERNPEEPRERYLEPAEWARLRDALNRRYGEIEAAALVFLMLTGARFGEAMAARWDEIISDGRVWSKPSAHTKQKRRHRVPLSASAQTLISDLPRTDDRLFPVSSNRVRAVWEAVRTEAGLPGLRIHDLRHSYAAVLASDGLSLPIIGALLGHSAPATTARYAHLLDDPLRQATERVGSLWTATADENEPPAAE
jgi:integrase